MDRLLELPQSKEQILGLPEKASYADVKMIFLGYTSLVKTGRKKSPARLQKEYEARLKAEETQRQEEQQDDNNIFDLEPEVTEVEEINEDRPRPLLGQAIMRTRTKRKEPQEIAYRKEDESLCYCLKCKKAVQTIIHKNVIQYSNRYKPSSYIGYNSNNVVYECPECGQSVSGSNILYLDCRYVVYRSYFKEGNKIKISKKDYRFRWLNNHLFVEEMKIRHVMNLDTGYTYVLAPMKNGKIMKKHGIKNVTYISSFADSGGTHYSSKCRSYGDLYAELYEVIRQYKMEKMNIFIPAFEQTTQYKTKNGLKRISEPIYNNHKEKKPNMQAVLLFNRFPTMNPGFAIRNFQLNSYEKDLIKMRRAIKVNTKDPLRDILEFYKVPATKSNKKRIEKCIEYPIYFSKINAVVNNYDNTNKLLNEEYLSDFYRGDVDTICDGLEILQEFKGFNINSFCNKALKERKYIVVDALKLAMQVLRKKEDYKFNFKCSIQELHDTLSKDYNKLRHENEIIKYEDEVKVLEGQYGELHFALAKDTHELIDVGTTMGICVGGYGDRAASKSLNIIVARDNENNPIICIEMCKNYFLIRQTKLKHNNTIKENTIEYTAIKTWAETHSLNFDTYYDVPDSLSKTHNERKEVILKAKKIEKLNNKKAPANAI